MADRGKLFTGLFMGGALLLGAAWTVGPYVFAGRDHDIAIDSPVVRDAATEACTDMNTRIAEGIPAVDAAEAMVARLRDLDPQALADDVPTDAWLADWDRLLAAERDGEPVPEVDGDRITRRMDDLVKDLRPCTVPKDLLPGR